MYTCSFIDRWLEQGAFIPTRHVHYSYVYETWIFWTNVMKQI